MIGALGFVTLVILVTLVTLMTCDTCNSCDINIDSFRKNDKLCIVVENKGSYGIYDTTATAFLGLFQLLSNNSIFQEDRRRESRAK
jgi:hypothetical protein